MNTLCVWEFMNNIFVLYYYIMIRWLYLQQSHWPQHMAVCGQNSDSGGGEGGPDSVNGEASGHSSRVSTPQNLVVTQVSSYFPDNVFSLFLFVVVL